MGGWCGSPHPNIEKTGAQPEPDRQSRPSPTHPRPGDSRKGEVWGVDKSLLMGGTYSSTYSWSRLAPESAGRTRTYWVVSRFIFPLPRLRLAQGTYSGALWKGHDKIALSHKCDPFVTK